MKQLFGIFNPYLIHVSVEIYAGFFAENLSEIRAVVAKKRSNRFQLQVFGIILPYVISDLIDDVFTGRIADRIHPQIKLFCQKLDHLIEVGFALKQCDRRSVCRKRDLLVGFELHDLLFDQQINIDQKMADCCDIITASVQEKIQCLQGFSQKCAVIGLDVAGKKPCIFGSQVCGDDRMQRCIRDKSIFTA